MTAPDPSRGPTPGPRRRRRRWIIALALVPLALAALAWSFTASLEDHVVAPPASSFRGSERGDALEVVADEPPAWPEGKLGGEAAKQVLLDVMKRVVARVEKVGAYTATFRRQERVGGVLGPEQVADLKIRNHPFAIYLKFRTPKPGKEVVYAEGHHDNKLIAHNGDWTRRLVPRLAVAPDSALAMIDSRHPVTDAGLLNLSWKLLRFRELDMGDDDATTDLDRTTVGPGAGRPCLRSTHTHSKPNDGRPFCHVEILYDPETQIPFQISSYDWPEPGHRGPLDLAERYTYDDLKLDAPLTAADFDPSNPDYAFMRF